MVLAAIGIYEVGVAIVNKSKLDALEALGFFLAAAVVLGIKSLK